MTIRVACLLLLVMGVGIPTWAATTYIDPTCTYDGDGTGQSCAASAAAVGARNVWPTVSGAGDSFLQKAGTTYLFQVSVGSGSSGNPVTLGAYGTGAKPIIRSEENVTVGSIKINTDAHDIVIDGIHCQGPLNVTVGVQRNCIRNNVTDVNNVVNITIQNCEISNVLFSLASSDDGIDLRGSGLYLYDNYIHDIANDGIWLSANNSDADLIVSGNTCERVSVGNTTGDCYQSAGSSTGGIFEDNYCDHTEVDSKYCIVNSSPGTIIRYNELRSFPGGTVNWPIFTLADDTKIYGNRTYGGSGGIANYSPIGGETYANVITGVRTVGIDISGGVGSLVYNNTIVNTGEAAIRFSSDSTNAKAWNNIVSHAADGVRLYSASGQTESNTLFHETIGTPVYNVTTGSALAATNGITASNQLTSDYKTLGASTARRAGRVWPGCLDARGRVCAPDRPDIGAYQSSSGDPAAPRAVRN